MICMQRSSSWTKLRQISKFLLDWSWMYSLTFTAFSTCIFFFRATYRSGVSKTFSLHRRHIKNPAGEELVQQDVGTWKYIQVLSEVVDCDYTSIHPAIFCTTYPTQSRGEPGAWPWELGHEWGKHANANPHTRGRDGFNIQPWRHFQILNTVCSWFQ